MMSTTGAPGFERLSRFIRMHLADTAPGLMMDTTIDHRFNQYIYSVYAGQSQVSIDVLAPEVTWFLNQLWTHDPRHATDYGPGQVNVSEDACELFAMIVDKITIEIQQDPVQFKIAPAGGNWL